MAKAGRGTVGKTKLSRQAYDILLHNIVSQRFKWGQKLQINELAEQLGISRTPVKEALNLLAAEGLIELIPQVGTFVKSFTRHEIAEIFDIRRALEVLAAESLLDHMVPPDLVRLETLVTNMEAAFKKGTDLLSYVHRNYEFHETLVQLSGNRRLLRVYQTLHVSVRATQISVNRETWKESFEEEAREHRAIISAIQAGNRSKLMTAIALHVERSKQRLIQSMKRRELEKMGHEPLNESYAIQEPVLIEEVSPFHSLSSPEPAWVPR